MRILLLEDSKDLQKATARLLRHTFAPIDVTIDIVDNVPGTIELLQQQRYDFVLSDYVVLRGNGGDVLNWIIANQPHMTERFVFFSGSSSLRQLHPKVIAKGVDVSEFVTLLQHYLAPMVTVP
jgi:CheY-like chemotaxis protein